MGFAKCQRCFMLQSKVCQRCYCGECCYGPGRCDCVNCTHCNKTHRRTGACDGCERCLFDCKCPRGIYNYAATILTRDATSCYGKDKTATFAINPLRRALGVEVELAEWGSLAIQNGHITDKNGEKIVRYIAAHDGSVRPSGFEMVINPLAGDRYVLGMVGLSSTLDLARATVNNSCGLHVHVDGSDFSPFDVRRLLYMLDRVEPELYSMCTHIREASAYCFPLMGLIKNLAPNFMIELSRMKSGGEIKAAFYKTFYMLNDTVERQSGEFVNKGKRLSRIKKAKKVFPTRLQVDQVQEVLGAKYGPMHRLRHLNRHDHLDNLRYAGVNLQSWLYRGSIEFRMKEGTTSPRELLMWPLLCGWIVESASRLTDNQVLKSTSLSDMLSAAKVPQGVIEYVEKAKTK